MWESCEITNLEMTIFFGIGTIALKVKQLMSSLKNNLENLVK